MADSDKKTGKAMADALGLNYVDDDADKNQDQNPDTNLDQDKNKDDQSQAQTDVDTKSDNKGDGADDDQSADKSDKDSSGDQLGGDGKGSDQANDSKTIPDTSKSGDGTDQGTNFDTMLAERSGGRFNSIADIDKALEEAPSNAFANEQIAKLNDYVKGGGRLEDFVRTQTVDYSQMSPQQLVAEKMALDDPEMSAQEIQLLMEEDFGVAEDASERVKQVAEAKLKRAAREAKKVLEENKAKWATPLPDQTEAQAKAQKLWQAQLSNVVDRVDSIDLALNQTDNFSFKLEADAKATIKENYKDLSKFFQRYVKADGTEDVERFVKDMAILENYEAIVRSAASSSKSQGKKDVIDGIKNPDFKGDSKGDSQDKPKSIIDQAAAEFFKHNMR